MKVGSRDVEGEVETEELVRGGVREPDRVMDGDGDTEGEGEIVEEMEGVGEEEGDLEEDTVTDTHLVVDRVRVLLEEVLGDNDPEEDLEGERLWEGEFE